jgi:acyl dehydratase
MKVMSGRDELLESVGETMGTSEWETIDQGRITAFAEVTGDRQWIHVDPVRAANGPFGSTIAHGYLTLSLLPVMVTQNYQITGMRLSVNYGLDRVRFTKPVPVNSRLRAESVLLDATTTNDGGVQIKFRHTVTMEGDDRIVCVADSLSRVYF